MSKQKANIALFLIATTAMLQLHAQNVAIWGDNSTYDKGELNYAGYGIDTTYEGSHTWGYYFEDSDSNHVSPPAPSTPFKIEITINDATFKFETADAYTMVKLISIIAFAKQEEFENQIKKEATAK